jgi:hypothetical protein
MADDNNKKKYTEEENKKRLQHMGSVQPPSFFQKRGIKDVDKPIRLGASADSTGYFAKKYDDLQKMEDSYIKELRDKKAPITKIPEEIKNRKLGKFDEFAYKYISSQPEVLGKIRAAQAEAKDNYFRQSEKGEKGVIFNYDKDGHYVGPFGGDKEAKKEIKPAKIVSPVKRPSEAVMKKVTGKK